MLPQIECSATRSNRYTFRRAKTPLENQLENHSIYFGEGESMDAMKFRTFKIKHRAWTTRLQDFLDGKGGLTEEQAISHKDCSLGKWMYSEGLEHYRTIPEMKSLEKVHIKLHDTVRSIISLKHDGKTAEAEAEYLKIGPISDEIIGLLTVIEKKVAAM
jgi:methyl-accepting chemotaxis protein